MNTIESEMVDVGHDIRTLRDAELSAVAGGADAQTTFSTMTSATTQVIKSMGESLQTITRSL